MKNLILILGSIIFATNIYAQSVILVPQDAPSIQVALDNASQGDSIFVMPGVYVENIEWPEELNVILKSIEGPETTIIDGNEQDPVIHMVSTWGTNSITTATIIDGFTIRNGKAENGGGMYIYSSSPTLKNIVFSNNECSGNAAYGGGLYIYSSESATVQGCSFINNRSDGNTWSYGAGMYLDNVQVAHIDNSTFTNNRCDGGNWAHGGGLYISADDSEITNCIFESNKVYGGSWGYGAGLYIENLINGSAEIKVTSSQFLHNYAESSRPYGNAIYASGGNFLLQSSLIKGNTFTTQGWNGSSVDIDDIEKGEIINCTIIDNQKGIELSGSEATIVNSIFWNNGSTILIFDWSQTLNFNLSHCIIEGGFGEFDNVFDTDPLFLSNEFGIPREDSPCLNAGSRDIFAPVDLYGNARPMPIGSAVDIGAVEIDQNFSHILSQFFYDENTDGVMDDDESLIGIGAIQVNNEVRQVNHDESGIFTLVEEGEVEIAFDKPSGDLWWLTTDETSFSFVVDGEEFADSVLFGIYPEREYGSLSTSIYLPRLRCNREVRLEGFAYNDGTVPKEGVLWIEMDELCKDVHEEIQADYTEENRYGWDTGELIPGEVFQRDILFTVPGVGEVEMGEELAFSSEVFGIEDCYDIFNIKDEVLCSYDPNDKLVYPQRSDNLSLLEDKLTYTIRFQNVGNDYADDVLVIDTLSEHLDLNTFTLIGTSHEDQLRLLFKEDGIIHFDFKQIYLPDSTTNLEGSNGYVMFSIFPKEGLAENTVIENTAHIYFDFNPAIVTNTTENILVEDFPVSTSNPTDLPSILVSPNPTSDIINFSENVDKAELYDAQGKLLRTAHFVSKMNLTSFASGSYLLKLKIRDEVETHRIGLVR